MKKCDPRAYAKCPDRKLCGDISNAIFVDGSDCDKFNEQVLSQPMTNGDRIRAMSDEELAEKMCGHAIDTICDIVCDRYCCAGTEDGCIAKLLDWLKQPAEVGT